MSENKRKRCSVCTRDIESDEPAILVMGAYASPRYLCSECEEDFDLLTTAADAELVGKTVEKIYKKLVDSNCTDEIVLEAVDEIKSSTAQRISGETCEQSEEELVEIPEELRESEEDIAEAKREEERAKIFDKVMNIVLAVALTGFAIFLIWYLIAVIF